MNRHRFCRSNSVLAIGLLFTVFLVLSGCAAKGEHQGGDGGFFSWFKKAAQPKPLDNEVALTREAMNYFQRGRYLLAEELFQKIRDRYPFSPYATLAELRLADCKFYLHRYEEAIPLYEEFEKLHPTNEAIPYVIFQESSCYYKLMAPPDRDQTFTKKLIETCERLLKRYPDSPFSYEARKRIAKARAVLARHELVVAKWYLRTHQIPQAINRLETILAMYPDTPVKDDAERLLSKARSRLTADDGGSSKGDRPWWKRIL